jgi:hypothetical protein
MITTNDGPALEWHAGKAYARCLTCGKLVQANKPLFGDLHFCLTECEQARRHLDQRTRRRGPIWKRRTETFCGRCGEVSK